MIQSVALLCLVALIATCGQQADAITPSPIPSSPVPIATPTTPTQVAPTTAPSPSPATEAAVFHVSPGKSDIIVEYEVQGSTVSFDVQSASGIGGARVTQVSGDPPSKILLVLYLKGLESLKLMFGTTQVQVSVSSSGAPSTSESVTTSGAAGEIPITSESEYWMPVEIVSQNPTIPLTDGYFQVELPRAFFASGAREFSLEWIDFYR